MPPISLPHTALAWSDFVTGALAMAAGTVLLVLERRPAVAAEAAPAGDARPSRAGAGANQ